MCGYWQIYLFGGCYYCGQLVVVVLWLLWIGCCGNEFVCGYYFDLICFLCGLFLYCINQFFDVIGYVVEELVMFVVVS